MKKQPVNSGIEADKTEYDHEVIKEFSYKNNKISLNLVNHCYN